MAAQGIHISETKVGHFLKQVDPVNLQSRITYTRQRLNPVPYHAHYFGHKLHVDQNEKLAMYGVTHVCASDGYSGKIVGFVTMPVKKHLYWWVQL